MTNHFYEVGSKAIVTGGRIRSNGEETIWAMVGYHTFDTGTIVKIIDCGKGTDVHGIPYLEVQNAKGTTQYIKKTDLMPYEEGGANEPK